MEFLDPTLKMYIALGAGGAAVVIIFASFLYLLFKIYPRLHTIEISTSNSSKAIEQNAEALSEVSRSNDNLAHALTLLEKGLSTTNDYMRAAIQKLNRQDEKLNDVHMVLTQIEVRTSSCAKPYKG